MKVEELNDWLQKMDEDGKVGWEKEDFLELNFNDKLAFAVSRFTSQVYNNGVDGFVYNGYEYLIGFLRSEVAETLNQKWLEDFWDKYEEILNRAEYYELTRDELDMDIENFEYKFYKEGYLTELREAAVKYLNNQEYK